MLLTGNWLELSPSFNMTYFGLFSIIREVFDPVVTHFMGLVKPWSGPRFLFDHPARAELEHFIPRSPWPDFLTQFFSFSDAWKSVHATHVEQRIETVLPPEWDTISQRYAEETAFADVEQGITKRRPSLPASATRPPPLRA